MEEPFKKHIISELVALLSDHNSTARRDAHQKIITVKSKWNHNHVYLHVSLETDMTVTIWTGSRKFFPKDEESKGVSLADPEAFEKIQAYVTHFLNYPDE